MKPRQGGTFIEALTVLVILAVLCFICFCWWRLFQATTLIEVIRWGFVVLSFGVGSSLVSNRASS